jgi:hypothetical protein
VCLWNLLTILQGLASATYRGRPLWLDRYLFPNAGKFRDLPCYKVGQVSCFFSPYLSPISKPLINQSINSFNTRLFESTIKSSIAMYIDKVILSLLASSIVTTALQVNSYSDTECKNYTGSSYPSNGCDSTPTDTNSCKIVCDASDQCTNLEIYSGCNGPLFTVLPCPCNVFTSSQDLNCISLSNGPYGWTAVNADTSQIGCVAINIS